MVLLNCLAGMSIIVQMAISWQRQLQAKLFSVPFLFVRASCVRANGFIAFEGISQGADNLFVFH